MTGMSETSARYNRIADAFGARLEGVTAEGWSAPTPWDLARATGQDEQLEEFAPHGHLRGNPASSQLGASVCQPGSDGVPDVGGEQRLGTLG